jgi:hypothetical protein
MELNPLIVGVVSIIIFMFGVIAILYYFLNKLEKEDVKDTT